MGLKNNGRGLEPVEEHSDAGLHWIEANQFGSVPKTAVVFTDFQRVTSTWPRSRLYLKLPMSDSPGSVASQSSAAILKTLLAANSAFCGLHSGMPKEKLDLLKFAPE